MKGSISASVVAPPMPGSSPTQKPMPMPSSMKANGFHCSTSSKPSMNASITVFLPPHVGGGRFPPLQGGGGPASSFAELYVLAELVDDVLRLRQHLFQDLHRLVPRGVVEIELRLVRIGHRRRVLDGGGEGFAVNLEDVGRSAGWQHVRPRDHFGCRAQRHDRFRTRRRREALVDRQLLEA